MHKRFFSLTFASLSTWFSADLNLQDVILHSPSLRSHRVLLFTHTLDQRKLTTTSGVKLNILCHFCCCCCRPTTHCNESRDLVDLLDTLHFTCVICSPQLANSVDATVLLLPPPPRNTNAYYCIEHVCMSVCIYVCLSIRMSQKRLVQTSRNFLYMLTVIMAQLYSDDNAIGYVLAVLWMR